MQNIISSGTIYSPSVVDKITTGPGAVSAPTSHYSGSSVSYSPPIDYSNARDVYDMERIPMMYDIDEYMSRAMRYNDNRYYDARNWEERMSNTQYTRAMQDLKNAGINPILAGRLGGASWHSVDPAYVNVGSLVGSMASANANLQSTAMLARKDIDIAKMSNENQLKIARAYVDNELAVAGINAQTQRAVAYIYGNYDIKKQELINDIQDRINQRNIKNEREMNSDRIIQQDINSFRNFTVGILQLGYINGPFGIGMNPLLLEGLIRLYNEDAGRYGMPSLDNVSNYSELGYGRYRKSYR